MSGIFSYCSHAVRKHDNRIGMVLLIKDEHDIVEDNIRFHAANGVDQFIVTDNGSTDGTREILERLTKEFSVHVIDEPSTDFLQAKWTTQMVQLAREKFSLDWVMCSDADEFWCPKEYNNYKTIFSSKIDSVINFNRLNMLMPISAKDTDYDYADTTLKVINPVVFDKKSKVVLTHDKLSMSLEKLGNKVAVNPYGLVRVKAGNHNAKHINRFNRYLSDDMTVYHYPFRSYARFQRQVENIILNINGGKAELGQASYRWKELYEKGQLDEEYERLILNAEDERVLRKYGILADDLRIGERIKSARVCA